MRMRGTLFPLPAGHDVDKAVDGLSLLDFQLAFLLLNHVQVLVEVLLQFHDVG